MPLAWHEKIACWAFASRMMFAKRNVKWKHVNCSPPAKSLAAFLHATWCISFFQNFRNLHFHSSSRSSNCSIYFYWLDKEKCVIKMRRKELIYTAQHNAHKCSKYTPNMRAHRDDEKSADIFRFCGWSLCKIQFEANTFTRGCVIDWQGYCVCVWRGVACMGVCNTHMTYNIYSICINAKHP